MKISVEPTNSVYDIKVTFSPYLWSVLELDTKNCQHPTEVMDSEDINNADSDELMVCNLCGSIGHVVYQGEDKELEWL